MRQRGQSTIVAAVIIGIIAVAGLYIFLPRITGTSGPNIPGVTEKTVKISVDVKVTSPSRDGTNMSLEILDHSLEERTFNQLKTIGPLWHFGPQKYNGSLKVSTYKEGTFVDKKTVNFELDEGWWASTDTKTFAMEWIELGSPGTGQYTIKAEIYDVDGNLEDTESITRSI